jgi:hypothetical protein
MKLGATEGGSIALLGREIVLDVGTVDASGATGGGQVCVGHVSNVPDTDTQTITVTPNSMIGADSLSSGPGGDIAIWSDQQTQFDGHVSAHGGSTEGDGGFIDVSGQGTVSFRGSADAGARHGRTGTLLLDPKNIVISAAPVGVFPQFDLIDPHPTTGGVFGITVLTSGNVVVTNPADDFSAPGAGVAYLFDGSTGALLSSLVGSGRNDQIGLDGVSTLTNGNYLVRSSYWNNYRGAVTWSSGITGISGVVADTNSLVGGNPGDAVFQHIFRLNNANYLVQSEGWEGFRGAVTWGSGTMGVTGVISAANSLIGVNANDFVGSNLVALSNGNYLAVSSNWNGGRGAVTWASGTSGISGFISDMNSLVGSNVSDLIGNGDLETLANGNYVICSPDWNGQRGAVTWGDGHTGARGSVSALNSLVGDNPGDHVGKGRSPDVKGITLLGNNNYVVVSPEWNSGRGAVTWARGATGAAGSVSPVNSLVGTDAGDFVGLNGLIPLSNGNYVVGSDWWNAQRGAATWLNGSAQFGGTISAANSLVGTDPGDAVGLFLTPLTNGNYVVGSSLWNQRRGAVTWGNGATGVHGVISAANSLIGSDPNDYVGANSLPPGPIITLRNGNFVVPSLFWHTGRGAVTWGDGSSGIVGVVSDINSTVGLSVNDQVGIGIQELANSNYVILSSWWSGKRGAVTWASGTASTVGTVSGTNSLVGSDPNDQVGAGLIPLPNGNYVVQSAFWGGNRGAATWGDGTTAIVGTVSVDNSLVGVSSNDEVGLVIRPLNNGNYIVHSLNWNESRGAVTWADGSKGIRGVVSGDNSLVGSSRSDDVGLGGISLLSNGNYVVDTPYWNGERGAVSWGSGTAGVSGPVSEANSLVGTTPREPLGIDGITFFGGNCLVRSPEWNASRGAVTWINGATGETLDHTNVITAQNSVLGTTPSINPGLVLDPIQQSFVVRFGSGASVHITVGLTDPNQFTYSRGQSQTVSLTPDFLTATLNTGTAVVLQASNDITVDDPIIVHGGGHGGALTLQAGRSIILNADITTDNGPLTVIANDTRPNGVVDAERDPGRAFITMAGGTVIDTGTAPLDIELRDGAGLTNPHSGAINLQAINAGSVTVANQGPDAGSDVRLGPVDSSGPQTYSSPNGVTTVAGDLNSNDHPISFADSVVINDAVTIDPGSSTINFTGSGVQTLQTGPDSSLTSLNHTGTGTLQPTDDLNVAGTFIQAAGIFDANDQSVTVTGSTILTGGTYQAGTAPQTFSGGLVVTAGVFTSSAGPMEVSGGVTVAGGSLQGEGIVDSLTVSGGSVTPGTANPGVLTVTGPTSFNPLTTLTVQLNGTDPGTGYSQLAGGPLDLGGSTLNLALGFEPPVGSTFEIVTTADPNGITGAFNGLPEGAIFTQAGYQFQITYQGGDSGTSIVLTTLGPG